MRSLPSRVLLRRCRPARWRQILARGKVADDRVAHAIDLLLWFGFLGVQVGSGEPMYSHTVRFTIRRLTHPIESGTGRFVIHPTFRKALDVAMG